MFSSKRRFGVVVVVVCLVGLGWMIAGTDGHRGTVGPEVAPGPPPGPLPAADPLDSREDPHARRNWEISRLRDPATGAIPPNMRRREQAFARTLPRREPGPLPGGSPADKMDGWSYRGPYNVGGRTRALAVDVSDPALATLLAGGVSGGMWRTVDDGQNWILTTGSSQLHSVTCVVQDTRPAHEQDWYYGTGEGRGSSPSWNGDSYRGDGIFKSTDGAASWDLLPATSAGLPQEFDSPFNYIWRLALDTSNLAQTELYAATWGVIYRSLDGGESWTAVLGDENQLARYSDVAIATDGVVYATLSTDGGEHGIFRSPDGLTWTDITPGIEPEHGRIAIGIAPSYEDIVYFLTSNPNTSAIHELWSYLYVSGNGSGSGGSWSERSPVLDQLPNPYYPGGPSVSFNPQRGYNLHVTVNPANYNRAYIGGMHLWRSLNGFGSASMVSRIGGYYYADRSHHADQHKLVFRPGSNLVAYSATDGGVHRTDDITATDVAWTSLNNGYDTSQFYTVAIDLDRSGNNAILGGTQDNGTLWTGSADGTADWVEVFGGDGAHCVVLDALFDHDYIVSYYFGNMYRINIGVGGNPLRQTRINPAGAADYTFINPFIADPSDDHVLYLATSNGVWRNDDVTGIPWYNEEPTSVNWVHVTTEPAGESITALATNAQPGHALYYGTADGGLYRLDDGINAPMGSSPVALHGNAGYPDGSYVSSIAVHPEDDQKVLVSLGNYLVPSLWYSEDGGDSWLDVEGNLAGDDGPSVRAATIVPGSGGDLWLIGTSTGLYSTPGAQGGSPLWVEEASEEIGNVVVDALTVRLSDRWLVAATHGRGIYSVTVPELTPVPAADPAILAQNVPNPFNPATEIRFNLPEAGPVRLEVFDIKGRRVRRLLDGRAAAGEQSVRWDGTDDQGLVVASGTYLYRLTTGSLAQERKMLLIR